jgi:hypothetical protein
MQEWKGLQSFVSPHLVSKKIKLAGCSSQIICCRLQSAHLESKTPSSGCNQWISNQFLGLSISWIVKSVHRNVESIRRNVKALVQKAKRIIHLAVCARFEKATNSVLKIK